MFAVIETGGKQYIVGENQKLKIEKLPLKAGEQVVFGKVLLLADGDNIKIGKPSLVGTSIEASLAPQGRGKKIRILRNHTKPRRRRRKGHRQPFSEVEIKSIKK